MHLQLYAHTLMLTLPCTQLPSSVVAPTATTASTCNNSTGAYLHPYIQIIVTALLYNNLSLDFSGFRPSITSSPRRKVGERRGEATCSSLVTFRNPLPFYSEGKFIIWVTFMGQAAITLSPAVHCLIARPTARAEGAHFLLQLVYLDRHVPVKLAHIGPLS